MYFNSSFLAIEWLCYKEICQCQLFFQSLFFRLWWIFWWPNNNNQYHHHHQEWTSKVKRMQLKVWPSNLNPHRRINFTETEKLVIYYLVCCKCWPIWTPKRLDDGFYYLKPWHSGSSWLVGLIPTHPLFG